MRSQAFAALFRRKLGTLVLFGLLFSALGFFSLMVLEKRFQASMDFLVVQTNAQNQDFYTQFKSSEYLGKVLGEAIYSERFVSAIVDSGKVNPKFLPTDKKEKLDAWSDMVTVKKNLELGIISVKIKSDSEHEANRIIGAVAQVLTEQNMLFRGGDEKSVEVRILSGPIAERNPDVAAIISVTVSGFIAGFLLSAFIVFLRREKGESESLISDALVLDEMPV